MLDPKTLDTLAEQPLPPRDPTTLGNVVHELRRRRLLLPRQPRPGRDPDDDAPRPGLRRDGRRLASRIVRDIDLSRRRSPAASRSQRAARLEGPHLVRLDARRGRHVGAAGKVVSRSLGEPIGNSFAVDEQGGVYVVTDAALYRFDAARGGRVKTIWRARYANIGVAKPGQSEKGSGTTPTLMGKRPTSSITDNADPMNVLVFKRARRVKGGRRVCRAAGLRQGRVGHRPVADRDRDVDGRREQLRLHRADLDEQGADHDARPRAREPDARTGAAAASRGPRARSRRRWCRSSRSRPGSSTRTPRTRIHHDPWYLTALDFRTGKTVFKVRAGSGIGYNNNYAPVTTGS